MKVFCYFNLHKLCWSVKALEGPHKGLVVAHLNRVNLSDITFKVSEAGRQRVLREKRKNVHAGVVGQWDGLYNVLSPDWNKEALGVSYNPYKAPTFVRRDTWEPITSCSKAHLSFGIVRVQL